MFTFWFSFYPTLSSVYLPQFWFSAVFYPSYSYYTQFVGPNGQPSWCSDDVIDPLNAIFLSTTNSINNTITDQIIIDETGSQTWQNISYEAFGIGPAGRSRGQIGAGEVERKGVFVILMIVPSPPRV